MSVWSRVGRIVLPSVCLAKTNGMIAHGNTRKGSIACVLNRTIIPRKAYLGAYYTDMWVRHQPCNQLVCLPFTLKLCVIIDEEKIVSMRSLNAKIVSTGKT